MGGKPPTATPVGAYPVFGVSGAAPTPANLRVVTCNWPVDDTCLPPLPAEDDPGYGAAVAARQAAVELAIQVLWALSGRQYGQCDALVRPCPTSACGGVRPGSPWDQTVAPMMPTFQGGQWTNVLCGCSTGRCNAAGPRAVHLPGPVGPVVTVTIEDVVQDPSEYTLEGDILYRNFGDWPGQDYNRPLGEDGTWSVVYLKGQPVPAGVGSFVGQLAKEFLAACSGDACRLPRNVVATTSRGVSRQYDPSTIYANGKTGLSEIDLWLAAVNPHALMQPPRVI